MLNECGICRQKRDQHLLAKCDTCHLYYHLNCLNPPLTRLPKKSKLYGWQCSECDKTSDSEVEEVKTPRRSKSRYSREARSEPEVTTPKLKIKPVEPVSAPTPEVIIIENNTPEINGYQSLDNSKIHISKSAKKRRREKHKNRYSPELGGSSKEHKRKRKKKSLDFDTPMPHPRITIKIKPIPLPAGEVASESNPQCFYVPNENNEYAPPLPQISVKLPQPPTPEKNIGSNCDVCHTGTQANNSVRCDDCQKVYHFTCLDPPLKKSPKKRGYSWHCADCDPTGSE